MSFLISLLLFLGVITSTEEFNEQDATYYEQEYATKENINNYERQNDPNDDDLM